MSVRVTKASRQRLTALNDSMICRPIATLATPLVGGSDIEYRSLLNWGFEHRNGTGQAGVCLVAC